MAFHTNGYHDCGLFAIAFAVVCLCKDLTHASFDQAVMRKHLLECLPVGTMKQFLSMSTSLECIPCPKPGILEVNLFCSCNMPAQYDSKWFSVIFVKSGSIFVV